MEIDLIQQNSAAPRTRWHREPCELDRARHCGIDPRWPRETERCELVKAFGDR